VIDWHHGAVTGQTPASDQLERNCSDGPKMSSRAVARLRLGHVTSSLVSILDVIHSQGSSKTTLDSHLRLVSTTVGAEAGYGRLHGSVPINPNAVAMGSPMDWRGLRLIHGSTGHARVGCPLMMSRTKQPDPIMLQLRRSLRRTAEGEA
jgi:hypothetical protein